MDLIKIIPCSKIVFYRRWKYSCDNDKVAPSFKKKRGNKLIINLADLSKLMTSHGKDQVPTVPQIQKKLY